MKSEIVRLHITPLTPALLPVVLGTALANSAKNISFHEIQTFPERNYGYVELETADAERLKRKLNGAILKGSKMNVDDARPKKRPRTETVVEEENEDKAVTEDTAARKEKRKSTRSNVVPGHEIAAERKVKRAWTEPRKEKRDKKAKTDSTTQQEGSKYTNKEELLFRTKVPANKTDLVTRKSKKSKKSKHGSEEATVHEFATTTTQPSFLKIQQSASRDNLTYEDGKGWVDDQGNIVEAEPSTLRQRRAQKSERKEALLKSKSAQKAKAKQATESTTDTKEPISTSVEGMTVASEQGPSKQNNADETVVDEAESSESSASESRSASAPDRHANSKPRAASTEVHPLESLFKRPPLPTAQDVVKPSLEISTAFSFFDQDTDEDSGEPVMPLTPFTSQDLRSRELRSAAPTPDTAYPSRFNSHDSVDVETEDEEDNDKHVPTSEGTAVPEPKISSSSNAAGDVSEFEKQFWEKRGENNRAWKARRRAVLKEKRHRENKARRPKNW